jgi:hypothetical protein
MCIVLSPSDLLLYRVINVIRSWLTDHLYEDDEAGLLDRISAFAVTLPKEHSQQLARIIERRVSILSYSFAIQTLILPNSE